MITELCPIFVITYSAEMNFLMPALSLCILTGLFLWNRFLQVELLCQKNIYTYYHVDKYCQISLQNDYTS